MLNEHQAFLLVRIEQLTEQARREHDRQAAELTTTLWQRARRALGRLRPTTRLTAALPARQH